MIALQSGQPWPYFKCPYQAKVMKTFDRISRKMVIIGLDSRIVYRASPGTGDYLAERCANADRRANGAKGEIKAARALREVGDHEDRDNAEYSRPHAIQDLDRDQFTSVARERVENRSEEHTSELQSPCNLV